ncbi:exonuclease SbcCD subunit D, partial [Glaciimonas sp. Cout2]|nr:exonuclease SbcCD subunit D [Glaciimonas sp. Cout2]
GAVPRDAAGAIELARLVVPLHEADGSIAAWCIAMPFLRPGDVPRLPAPTAEAEAQAAAAPDPYLAGIALLYQQATAHARGLRSAAQPLIAMGHCHMVGGEISAESE